MNENITPEVIKALATLRDQAYGGSNGPLMSAINVLDNAGIFAAIDEATGYDVDPEAERISKCRCQVYSSNRDHETGCQGDPAEWGDMAYTSKVPGWSQAVEAQRKMNAARTTR